MSNKFVQETLKKYALSNPVRFHMPGHKGTVNTYDVTEVSATDNLNSPETCFLRAQKALADSYCSAESFFMVNGATGAIHAMCKYAQQYSEQPILVSRNCHKSILSACMLFNIDMVFLEDEFDNNSQTYIFDEQKIINHINEYNNLSAVVITPVDYFGRVADVSKISKLCKEKDILLLCDEAHGAHFHISDMLPNTSLPYADICVHSPHKTLSALTQCAYVHISDKINSEKFKNIIYSLQTSSPSFLLAQSMDNARYEADTMKSQWENRVKSAKKLCEKINKLDGIKTLGEDWTKLGGYFQKDATRLVIDVSKVGSGIEISKLLEQKHNIFMEMCTFKYLVGILTPWDKLEWDAKLYDALYEISKNKKIEYHIPHLPANHTSAMSINDASKAQWKKILFNDSAGEIAAAAIGVYPPGVALVLPGEIISDEIIEYMQKVHRLGGSLFGVSDGCINCIKGEP